MLGLGLGLGKGGSVFNFAKSLYGQYFIRVTAAGGVFQNAVCALNGLLGLNSNGLLKDASLVLIPDGIKEDIVFTEKPNSALGDLDFTRASDATYTDSTGVIRLSPYNLFTYSQELENVLWLTNNITIVANAGVAPDGTSTADSYASTITVGPHPCYQSKVVPLGTYTYSVYVKKVNSRYVSLKGAGGMLIWTGVIFDLDTASVVSVQHNNIPGTTGSITSEGNGWYRISMTATSNFNDFGLQYASSASNTFGNYGDLTIAGSGLVDYLLWGMQVVQGSSRMNYFATTDRLNVPRIDFRNADGTLNTCGRLLLEPQRTNLVPNRLLYNATTGVAYDTTVSGSPMAGVNCARITKNEAAGTLRYAQQNCTSSVLAGSTGYVLSAFFKYDGVDVVTSMQFNNSFQWGGTSWTQVINIAAAGVTLGTSTFCTSTVQNWGSGWYRVNVIITTGASPTGSPVIYLLALPSTLSTGQGFLHALPQLEAGAYQTSYIPTVFAAVTRIGDSFTRANIFTNGFITAAGGTLFLDLSDNIGYTRDSTSTGFFLDTVNGSFTNGFNIRNTGGFASRLNISKWVAGVGSSLFTTTTTAVKIAIKWNGTTADVFVNGVKQVSATSFTTTNMQFLASYINQVPIEINQMWLAPTPLSDAVCIQITTL